MHGAIRKREYNKRRRQKKGLNINEYEKVYRRRFSTFKCLDNGEND